MSGPRGPGEQWPALESVGLSHKELALAEALQMEYDALSRLRQDKDKEESRARKEQLRERPLISWDDPSDRNGCPGIKATRGLSGSDPTLSLNVPAVPECPQVPPGPSPARPEPQPWQKGPLSGDYLLIFEGSQRDFLGEPLNGSQPHSGGSSPKKLSPPPLPPRHPLWGCPEGGQRSPLSPKGQGQPRDINMFSVAQDKLLGRRISQEDPYGVDAITCLNLKSTYECEGLREGSRGWKEGRSILEKESCGKPVARSKTMPPQVPPRTYGARVGSRKNLAPNRNRRISVEPVRGFPLLGMLCFWGWGGCRAGNSALGCPRAGSGWVLLVPSLWLLVGCGSMEISHGPALVRAPKTDGPTFHGGPGVTQAAPQGVPHQGVGPRVAPG